MSDIRLLNGGHARVDRCDLPLIEGYDWYRRDTEWASYACAYKAAAHRAGSTTIHMHRLILGAPAERLVDHRNGNGLDNRRSNLRLASAAQNGANMRGQRGSTSRYKGVWWETRTQRWCAAINNGTQRVWLGRFESEKEAAAAYDVVAAELFGEFARLNLGG